MKRMMLSLPVGIWTFVILSGYVGSQVASWAGILFRPANRKLRWDIFAMRLSSILTTRLPTQSPKKDKGKRIRDKPVVRDT